MPDSVSILRYNICGLSKWYDYGNMIYRTQTDTSVSVDAINRVLKHMAERHIDTISAKELGSILHIADIGDVDITGITDNALFVYKKENNCASGCEGINNRWIAWNNADNMTDSMHSVMGFDANGAPISLLPPANANRYYMLGWDPDNKVSYTQPVEKTKESIQVTEGGVNYIYKVCIDPSDNRLVYIKERVS